MSSTVHSSSTNSLEYSWRQNQQASEEWFQLTCLSSSLWENMMHNSWVNFIIYVRPVQAADIWAKMMHNSQFNFIVYVRPLQAAVIWENVMHTYGWTSSPMLDLYRSQMALSTSLEKCFIKGITVKYRHPNSSYSCCLWVKGSFTYVTRKFSFWSSCHSRPNHILTLHQYITNWFYMHNICWEGVWGSSFLSPKTL